ncbi:apolipoprotein N-acyltransferase [candidate division KSB1 bacterium]|nr:apolipoprotein N-acyltransferase [candidate division KSB1 bacterium]RQW01394.1 MAG: apolipoprotein N-acyltransferase [candidate division KSB1 bacterium]
MKKNILLSLLTGITFALALPPFKTGFFAYVSLIPFFLLLEDKSIADAFRWGYFTGLCIAAGTLFWLGWVTLPGLFGVIIFWPLAMAAYGVLHVFLLREFSSYALAAVPFIWTALEYAESFSELAFPWNYIGYTQTYYLPLIQYAEFTSIYGISFWVVMLNVLFYLLWKNRGRARIALSLAIVLLFAAPLFHGMQVMRGDDGSDRTIKIALIQGNRDPNEKWDGDVKGSNYEVYERLTRAILASEPDLVIWPETAMPFYLRAEIDYIKKMHALIDSTGALLLTGTLDYKYLDDGSYDYYNSAFLLEPSIYDMQRYAKMKLVPFSERVPYKDYFPFNVLKDLLWDLGLGDYAFGKEIAVLGGRFRSAPPSRSASHTSATEGRYQTGIAICYESVFPDHVRKYVNAGADFLIIITNDAWFGKTSAPFQHAQMAALRAIENRRDIARCANTGISCFIDRFGRVRRQTGLYVEAVLTDTLQLYDEKTFYTLYGNIFAIFVSIVSLLILTLAVVKRLMQR